MPNTFGQPFSLSLERERLTYEFMREFSRFEFSLKRSGYARQDRTQLIVEWRRFAEVHPVTYNTKPASVEYLVRNPPRRQVISGGTLGWEPMELPPNPLTLSWLLTAAYIVRNNLFHGGKWTDVSECLRDEALISAARAVIPLALDTSETARNYYEDPV